ncbi:phosphatase PAP2 family protein [Gordonia phthalatica]|uniref:phosphatase PAP2 family protein n=1 Tax=Gordonia phthalatica TaxID=1136941 RepID=UPI0012FF25CA|nr:phosphatase PAP2 family protein [Gordonia phthalatica]
MTTRIAPLIVGAAALAAMAVVYQVLVVSYSGQVVDHDAMLTLGALTGHDVPTFGTLGRLQIPILFAAAAVIAAVCLGRRSVRLFANACLVVLGTTVAAVILQAGLDRPTLGIGQLNSFPSKTVAAFTAVAIAICAVVPRRVLPAVAPIVLTVVAAVSAGVVSLLWHRPSDVIGGVLLAVAVAALAEYAVPVWTRAHRRVGPAGVPDWRQPLRG